MTGHVKIGDTLDRMGVGADLRDDDLVASAVVVMSVLSEGSSQPRLCIASSEAMSWIEQAGLLRLAEQIVSDPPPEIVSGPLPEADE